jgi:hypothetical protein
VILDSDGTMKNRIVSDAQFIIAQSVNLIQVQKKYVIHVLMIFSLMSMENHVLKTLITAKVQLMVSVIVITIVRIVMTLISLTLN